MLHDCRFRQPGRILCTALTAKLVITSPYTSFFLFWCRVSAKSIQPQPFPEKWLLPITAFFFLAIRAIPIPIVYFIFFPDSFCLFYFFAWTGQGNSNFALPFRYRAKHIFFVFGCCFVVLFFFCQGRCELTPTATILPWFLSQLMSSCHRSNPSHSFTCELQSW